MLVRQFQCLSEALTDPCPLVRVAAAQGICTILNLYWEIILSATTAGYVSRLTGGVWLLRPGEPAVMALAQLQVECIDSKPRSRSHCWCAEMPERGLDVDCANIIC
jgi:hypothetical protein